MTKGTIKKLCLYIVAFTQLHFHKKYITELIKTFDSKYFYV
jgi:hypothetical protein